MASSSKFFLLNVGDKDIHFKNSVLDKSLESAIWGINSNHAKNVSLENSAREMLTMGDKVYALVYENESDGKPRALVQIKSIETEEGAPRDWEPEMNSVARILPEVIISDRYPVQLFHYGEI